MTQEAKEVLSDPEKRKDYDKWKGSGITISYKQWKAMKGSSTPVSNILFVNKQVLSRTIEIMLEWLQVFHWATHNSDGRMLESSNMEQARATFQQHAYSHENEIGDRSHQSYNSLLRKFRNYEI